MFELWRPRRSHVPMVESKVTDVGPGPAPHRAVCWQTYHRTGIAVRPFGLCMSLIDTCDLSTGRPRVIIERVPCSKSVSDSVHWLLLGPRNGKDWIRVRKYGSMTTVKRSVEGWQTVDLHAASP